MSITNSADEPDVAPDEVDRLVEALCRPVLQGQQHERRRRRRRRERRSRPRALSTRGREPLGQPVEGLGSPSLQPPLDVVGVVRADGDDGHGRSGRRRGPARATEAQPRTSRRAARRRRRRTWMPEKAITVATAAARWKRCRRRVRRLAVPEVGVQQHVAAPGLATCPGGHQRGIVLADDALVALDRGLRQQPQHGDDAPSGAASPGRSAGRAPSRRGSSSQSGRTVHPGTPYRKHCQAPMSMATTQGVTTKNTVSSRPETRTARAPHRDWPVPWREPDPRPVGEVHQREREQDQPERAPHPAEEALHARGQCAPGVGLDADRCCSRGRGRGPCRPWCGRSR